MRWCIFCNNSSLRISFSTEICACYACCEYSSLILRSILLLIIIIRIYLQPLCTPISASSKIVQLFEILRSKDSTTISLLTWVISAFTNLSNLFYYFLSQYDNYFRIRLFSARIYTVSVESGDSMLLANFTISFALSSAVLAAAYYYKHDKPKLFWQQKTIRVFTKEIKPPKVATN